MPCKFSLTILCAVALLVSYASAADLVHAKDGSGVYGYKDTPRLPWCQWLVHDQNGVLVQLNEEIHGETGHRIIPEYKHKVSRGPLAFGGHGCPVRFRNIWLRPLEN
jgi:hypothetical protein